MKDPVRGNQRKPTPLVAEGGEGIGKEEEKRGIAVYSFHREKKEIAFICGEEEREDEKKGWGLRRRLGSLLLIRRGRG